MYQKLVQKILQFEFQKEIQVHSVKRISECDTATYYWRMALRQLLMLQRTSSQKSALHPVSLKFKQARHPSSLAKSQNLGMPGIQKVDNYNSFLKS
jgi:hypothetical protein